MAKTYAVPRLEKRLPMEVSVQITGHPETPGLEATFTQDVSSRGARVLTIRKWRQNDRLTISTRPGEFQSIARVAYCHRASDEGYAIGLEFMAASGNWVVNPPQD